MSTTALNTWQGTSSLRGTSATATVTATVGRMVDGSAVGMAIGWLALASATLVRMPLPIGDPLLVMLGGNSGILAAASVVAGALVTASGEVFAGLVMVFAAVPFGYKRWKVSLAAEAVRSRFVEAGVSVAQQSEAEEVLSTAGPPLAIRISPLLGSLVCDGRLCSGVTVQRHHFQYADAGRGYVDIWQLSSQGAEQPSRGILFFVHGGSWMTMRPRCHAATRTLHALALAGWVVAACSYRKAEWPQHVEDAHTALRWVIQKEVALRNRPLVLAGNSAGAHIAALVADSAVRNGIDVSACVLSYGVFDPQDECRHYPTLCGKSLLTWYFEVMVLHRREDLWSTAVPVNLPLANFPPTLLLHGQLDGIVPVGQSRQFLARLQAARARVPAPQDFLVEVPSARHSYEVGGDAAAKAVLVGMTAWLENLAHTSARR